MDGLPFVRLILSIIGIAILINSKKALTLALKGGNGGTYWFLAFTLIGLAMLLPFIYSGITNFLPFTPLIIIYVILLIKGKEHSLLSELVGFSLLCISAPIVYFILTGDFSFKLYLVVFMFFASGVFKVRVRMRRTITHRVIMSLYCLFVFVAFRYLNIPTIILLPLIENIITSLWIREEGLKTTGQIELAKGIVFTVLFVSFGYESI
ncbi:MAG: hypothetical protein Fur0020_09610 [Thermodesulfovibrionia bacterium]